MKFLKLILMNSIFLTIQTFALAPESLIQVDINQKNKIFKQTDYSIISNVLSIKRGPSSRVLEWESVLFELLAKRLKLNTLLEVGAHQNSSARIGMFIGGLTEYTSIDYYDTWKKESRKFAEEYKKDIFNKQDFKGKREYVSGWCRSEVTKDFMTDQEKNEIVSRRSRILSIFKLKPGIKGITEKAVDAVLFNHSLGFIVDYKDKNKKLSKAIQRAQSVLAPRGWIIIKAGSFDLYSEKNSLHALKVIEPILKQYKFKNIMSFIGETDKTKNSKTPPNIVIIAQNDKRIDTETRKNKRLLWIENIFKHIKKST